MRDTPPNPERNAKKEELLKRRGELIDIKDKAIDHLGALTRQETKTGSGEIPDDAPAPVVVETDPAVEAPVIIETPTSPVETETIPAEFPPQVEPAPVTPPAVEAKAPAPARPKKNRVENEKRDKKKEIETEFIRMARKPLDTYSKEKLEEALAWIVKESQSEDATEFRARMQQLGKEMTKALLELPLRKVKVGTTLVIGGETYQVTEIPTPDNKERYSLQGKSGILYKPDKSKLLGMLERKKETAPVKDEARAPETPTPNEKKAAVIARLKEVIQNAQAVIERNEARRLEILARLAELEK